MLKSFRYLLFPFSILYGLILVVRNWLFDKKILRSSGFNFPLICIGNLSVGGTGKTPMVEYIIGLLSDFKVASLSRGYKRKTKGFAIADEQTTAVELGDEPIQIHRKFPQVAVAVAEERVIGIPQLLHDRPETNVILLDDAFQHRAVIAGLNILLTDYNNLYMRDLPLPAGDLRDTRRSSRRADIIIVTKCRSALSQRERDSIIREIDPLPNQKVFFTKNQYGAPYHLFNKTTLIPSRETEVLLVCGIANPRTIKQALDTIVDNYDILSYSDHHIFTTADLREIKEHFEKLNAPSKMIITTEKDAVRLEKFKEEISELPIYAWPVHHRFLFDEEDAFKKKIIDFVSSYSEK